jgi:hypothetical protein
MVVKSQTIFEKNKFEQAISQTIASIEKKIDSEVVQHLV